MALKGNISDLSVADLIQLQCQAAAQARLKVQTANWQAALYFSGGEVVHGQSPDDQGEAVVYRLLALDEGTFEVTAGEAAPMQSIHLPWSALILEGLRRKDEQAGSLAPETAHLAFVAQMSFEADLPAAQPDRLSQTLSLLVSQTSFLGLAVVGRDGKVLAAHLPGSLEVARVGAVAAGLLSLSGRSVGQLGRGELLQTLIQGSDGNLIITQVGEQAVLLALSPVEVNLGMAFLEAREGAATLAAALAVGEAG